MAHYLRERENGARYIESRTHAPDTYLAIVPDDLASEDADALVVETVTDEMGNEHKRVSVNEAKREEMRLAREAEKAQRDADAKARDERRARMKAIDWAKVNTVAELKAVVKDLVDDK